MKSTPIIVSREIKHIVELDCDEYNKVKQLSEIRCNNITCSDCPMSQFNTASCVVSLAKDVLKTIEREETKHEKLV